MSFDSGPLEETCFFKISTKKHFSRFKVLLESSNLCGWDAEPKSNEFEEEEIINGNHMLYAAYADGVLLGYCYCEILSGMAKLHLLCAKSEVKLGVGPTLLRFTEAAAKAKGCRKMVIPQALREAKQFYLRNRYTIKTENNFFSYLEKIL
jgi:hypothetical protein